MTERHCERGGPGRASRPPELQAVDGRVSHPARGRLTFRAVGSCIPFRWPEPGQTGMRNPHHPSGASGQLPPWGVRTIEQHCKWGGMGRASRLHGPRAPDGRASRPVHRVQLGMRNPLAPLSGTCPQMNGLERQNGGTSFRTAVTSDPGGATGATIFQRKAHFEPYDREAAEAQMSGLEHQNGGTSFERP